MPVVKDDVRKLATIETIAEVRPIEGADAIEVATVRGWNVVIKKNEFAKGDVVVYFEVDTALPVNDARFSFLAPRGVKSDTECGDVHVLKTVRLRGEYSQGLVLPVKDFVDDIRSWMAKNGEVSSMDPQVGMDVTEALQLGKWEIPLPVGGGTQKGNFLTKYARKTDSERVQNLVKAWPFILQHEWEGSEKIDGTSCTVVRDEDGKLRVMGRNWEMDEGDNTYWNAVHRYHQLFDNLENGEGLQFEIAGPGIQGNRLALGEVRPFVFDMVRNSVMIPRSEWPDVVKKWAAPLRDDITIPEDPMELVHMVDGLKSVVTSGRLAEGVVFHTKNGEVVKAVGDRNTFKVISSKYLLKEK